MSELLALPKIDELKALRRSIGYFGLGFVQIKLSDTERIHVYHRVSPSVSDESIHNHRYNFSSAILKGRLHQEIFVALGGGNSVVLRNESCLPGIDLPSGEVTVDVMSLGAQEFATGSTYSLNFRTFHRVKPIGTTVTRLTREAGYRQTEAQVIEPLGTPKVCPFESDLKEDELWEIVDEALKTKGD